jgi:hypothetical protein
MKKGGVDVVCWKAATVETGKTTGREVGKWWVQIAPLAGIRRCCLNFGVKCRLRGAYGRTLIAFFVLFSSLNEIALMVGIT